MTRFLLILLLACCGCRSTVWTHGVPNLHVIEPGLARCGQPTAEGFTYLRSLGYSNVVKLNTGAEPGAAEAGMRVVRYPITTWQQAFGPCELQVRQAADFLGAHPGTAVHCTYGVNRTGTAVIFYRVYYDRWSKARAVAEAERYGWDSSLPSLKASVRRLQQ